MDAGRTSGRTSAIFAFGRNLADARAFCACILEKRVAVASVLAGSVAGVMVLALVGIPWTLRFRERQAAIGHRRRRRADARA